MGILGSGHCQPLTGFGTAGHLEMPLIPSGLMSLAIVRLVEQVEIVRVKSCNKASRQGTRFNRVDVWFTQGFYQNLWLPDECVRF